MAHTPTPEQAAIIEAARDTEDNLIISALAGAAKTSTLVMLSEAVPVRTLCLAFNKKIADEMRERLPSHSDSMTLNSLGHRVWGEVIGRRLQIEAGKVGDIIKPMIEAIDDPEIKKLAWSGFADLIKAVSFGKQCGYIPTGYGRGAKPLMNDEEFQEHYETRFEDWEWEIVREASKRSLDAAWQGKCDYDDQILMPTIFPAAFPRYPLVLIDEAQDLSALNHATLRKLVVKRLIAVGDPCQAIYGFRGAHEESMQVLEERFSMRKMMLSISFRCPIKIVEHARWRAPHMQWPEWAKTGEVRYLGTWGIEDIPSDAAIICRNNAPLFTMAIKLLQRGRYAQLVGNDIGKGLLRVMMKFGKPDMKQREVLEAIASWEADKKAKSRNPGSIADRAECMRIFARQGKTLSDAIAYAEHIFASEGPIKLMTGHKSKGLEFDNVFILDRELLKDEGQDRNLRYVMITRAKDTLTYIDSKDLATEQSNA
jgi:DNA helicase-2/ATP-dependent DNA helicase PcrA